MTVEMIIVLVLVVVAVILFATEKLPVDLVALLIMATLLVSGIVTPEEGLAGFSNTATVTVGAMFVLSAGLFKTGAINTIGARFARLTKYNYWLALAALMGVIGTVSAFINNTAAVAVFMPLVLSAAREAKISPSKLLMPLSFASMFGGVCTLIGTSTNILVASIAERYGQPAFTMFEFAPLGLIFFAVGAIYMLFIGVRLIPERRPSGGLTEEFRLNDYLTEIVLLPEADSVGKQLRESPLVRDLDIDIIEIVRNRQRIAIPHPDTILQANDLLRVRCDVEQINKIEERRGVVLKPAMKWRENDREGDVESARSVVVEAVIAPNSSLEGRTLKQVGFRSNFGATVLAIRHRGQLMRQKLSTMPLRAGDALLVEVKRDQLPRLRQHRAFVIVSEVGFPEFRKDKIVTAILIIAGVVITATINLLPIVVSAIVGSILLILTGCIDLEETYHAIEWRVIFLLAGVLTLGIALEKTGAAVVVADLLTSSVGGLGPVAIMSALYILTSLMTEAMSNNATAVLLAPIAVVTADSLGVDARPFLMAVSFAASASFMTPVGYQTNTLIYGPGQYKFADFLRVGTPLNLMFWILATIFIPVFWPF